MKKFLFVVVTVLLSQSVFAQSNFSFGVKGGVNLNQISTEGDGVGQNIKDSFATKTGFTAGIFSRIGNKFYVQPEIMYVERNGTLVDGTENYKIKFKSVDVPVLVGIKIANVLRINAGPVANIKLSERNDFWKTFASATDKESFKNASFGYQAGAGLSFGPLDIDLRKDGSLGSISSKHFQDEKYNQKLDGWQLTAGLRF